MKFIGALKAERSVTQLLAEPDASSPTAKKAVATLKNSGPGAIPIMIDALANADRHQTIGIVDALTALVNDRTFKAFVEGLCDANERCVAGVAWALSSAETFSVDKLLLALGKEDVSTAAVLDIMKSHLDKLNVRQLLQAAYDLDAAEKKAIFKLIAAKADEELVPDLIARTAGRDHAARIHIISILSQFSMPEVMRTLEELLTDDNRAVRGAALDAIGKLTLPQNIELISSLLLDTDLEVQSKAVDLLVKINEPETAKYLLGVLRDESEYSRRSAVEVLNEIADSSSVKELLSILGDEDWWVRSRACDALGNIGGDKVLVAVMNLVGDKDENVRRSAIEILNHTQDPRAVKYLLKATEDSDWWVVERSVDALGEIRDKQALPRLVLMLEGEDKTLPAVLRAIGKIGGNEAVPPVTALLQRIEPEIVSAAVTALSHLIDDITVNDIRAAIAALVESANETVAMAAIEAMERINERYSPSIMEENEKAALMAEPAHTMLISDSAMNKLAVKMGDDATAALPPTSTALGSDAAPIDVSKLQPGDIIETRYKYVQKIGKGAFGTVILVEDTVVEEELILKFLNPNMSTDEEMLKRFVHELRFSRKITHKNVIRIYDFLKLAGAYAISMEYFPSHTLGQEIPDSQPMDFDKAAGWAIDIATGMSVAHDVGIIHRDLKPANLLIDDDGLLKIVDFGVAAAAGASDTQLTKTGYVIGSPKYMAPEQILGKRVDTRADIYSLGVILYEMLTGVPPYSTGDHMAVMYQHVQGKRTDCDILNPAISKPLAAVVHKAMEVEKAKRFESMEEFRKAIEAASSA